MTAIPLPGFDAPAVGFDQPFEMLEACHDRVRRSLSLLKKLVAHIDAQGHDRQSQDAARDVLRYFDVAAPLHHQDEELHVFPAVLQADDGAQAAAVRKLLDEHRRMSALWAQLREPLSRWASMESGVVDQATRALVDQFCAVCSAHLEREEGLVFPAARALTDPSGLARMGEEMQRRRRA